MERVHARGARPSERCGRLLQRDVALRGVQPLLRERDRVGGRQRVGFGPSALPDEPGDPLPVPLSELQLKLRLPLRRPRCLCSRCGDTKLARLDAVIERRHDGVGLDPIALVDAQLAQLRRELELLATAPTGGGGGAAAAREAVQWQALLEQTILARREEKEREIEAEHAGALVGLMRAAGLA